MSLIKKNIYIYKCHFDKWSVELKDVSVALNMRRKWSYPCAVIILKQGQSFPMLVSE